MFNLLKTRRGRLYAKLVTKFNPSPEALAMLMKIFDEYEKDNLDTIEKLKRERKTELNKINGALRQALNAHPVITKELIGSISKRIYGAMLNNAKTPTSNISKKQIIITIILILSYLIGIGILVFVL